MLYIIPKYINLSENNTSSFDLSGSDSVDRWNLSLNSVSVMQSQFSLNKNNIDGFIESGR